MTQRDLNIEMFETVLTRCHIERMRDRLRRGYGPYAERRSLRRIALPRDLVVQALRSGPASAARMDRAKKAIRRPAFLMVCLLRKGLPQLWKRFRSHRCLSSGGARAWDVSSGAND